VRVEFRRRNLVVAGVVLAGGVGLQWCFALTEEAYGWDVRVGCTGEKRVRVRRVSIGEGRARRRREAGCLAGGHETFWFDFVTERENVSKLVCVTLL
jgi:hypothetical protein